MFETWLDTLIEEKGIDLEDTFEFELNGMWHLMPYGVVVESMKNADPSMQVLCRNTLVKIDVANGDIKHFLRHMGQAVVELRG